jgi:hypothetical protein
LVGLEELVGLEDVDMDDEDEVAEAGEFANMKAALVEALANSSISPQTALTRYIFFISPLHCIAYTARP